jgi:hypothetical protein
MIDLGLRLHVILTNAYTLFSGALGLWALLFIAQRRDIDGQYWGAVAIHSFLAVAIFVATIVLTLTGHGPTRWVYWLYLIYFMIVLPATYALLKGRDDRAAAQTFAAVCIFTALASWNRAELLYTTALAG